MTSPTVNYFDDKDLDDAALWAAIDSVAAASSLSSSTKSHKPLALKNSPIPKPTPSPHVHLPKHPRDSPTYPDGEVLQNKPPKFARITSPCVSEISEMSPLPLVKVKHGQRTTNSPRESDFSPVRYVQFDDGVGDMGMTAPHCLAGRFPTVSLFKEYQNAAMAILEKSDYTMISGNPFIKKTGWRKISFYFNVSYEIRDKTIEFDENRNVIRAEFVVRAFMQGGRFSDGWGSCERREKRFLKPNHDIPSTAETRAKNRACQDLLGIGEYRPGSSHAK